MENFNVDVLLMYWRINNLFPTSVGINTFITIMLYSQTDMGAVTELVETCLVTPPKCVPPNQFIPPKA